MSKVARDSPCGSFVCKPATLSCWTGAVSRRPHKIISERGYPAVWDVPFGPAPLCVGIVTSPNPSKFAQVTIANLVIIMPSL